MAYDVDPDRFLRKVLSTFLERFLREGLEVPTETEPRIFDAAPTASWAAPYQTVRVQDAFEVGLPSGCVALIGEDLEKYQDATGKPIELAVLFSSSCGDSVFTVTDVLRLPGMSSAYRKSVYSLLASIVAESFRTRVSNTGTVIQSPTTIRLGGVCALAYGYKYSLDLDLKTQTVAIWEVLVLRGGVVWVLRFTSPGQVAFQEVSVVSIIHNWVWL